MTQIISILGKEITNQEVAFININTGELLIDLFTNYLANFSSNKKYSVPHCIGTKIECHQYFQKYGDMFKRKNTHPDFQFIHILHEQNKIIGEKSTYQIHSIIQFSSNLISELGLPIYIGYIEDIKLFGEKHNLNLNLKGEKEYKYPSERIYQSNNLNENNRTFSVKEEINVKNNYVVFENPLKKENYVLIQQDYCQEPISSILKHGTYDECKLFKENLELINSFKEIKLNDGREVFDNLEHQLYNDLTKALETLDKIIDTRGGKESIVFRLKVNILESLEILDDMEEENSLY